MAVLGVGPGRWLAWHRRLGVAACGAVVLWSLSGAMHPLMSRYQPRPAAAAPPPVVAPGPAAPSLAAILAATGIETVSHARLVGLEARAAWQVEVPGARVLRYFDAADGRAIEDGEAAHARALARHYLGDASAPIVELARVEAFGGEYAWVNRLLPVYRVRFARPDGMRVYVEPRSALLATLIDDRKALFNAVFLYGHTWRLPGLPDPARAALAALALLTVIAMPVLGLAVWLARRGALPARGLRGWHRRLGLTVAAVLLASAASGSWHLAKGLLDRAAGRERPVRAAVPMPASALLTQRVPAGSYATLSLVSVEGHVYARIATASAPAAAGNHGASHHGGGQAPPLPTVRYLPLDDGAPALDDARYARRLADLLAPGCAGRCDLPSATPQPVTAFGGEYGFVNKLLPVWRFEANDWRLYVHPETGTLAARIGRADHAEGWAFAQLHKWQGLEPALGRWPRDLLQIAWALMSAATAALGLRLFLGSPRRGRPRAGRS